MVEETTDKKQDTPKVDSSKQNTKKIVTAIVLGLILFYAVYNHGEKYKLSFIISIVTKILKVILQIGLVLTVVFTGFTIISTLIENKQYKTFKHGIKLEVNGHKMVASVEGENKDKTIIILTGFCSASPVLHYKPLVKALCDQYRTVVLEPFGYGLSDNFDPKDSERTIQNIVEELHSAVKQLGIDHYYLMGHSMGGAYGLYWANKYPDEVKGFIGFDATVLVDEEIHILTDKYIQKLGRLRFLGIQRIMSLFNKRNVFLPLYEKFDYTDEEISKFRTISIRNSLNKLILDESRLMLDNVRAVSEMKFPKHIPVLNYVCGENCKAIPTWKELHVANGSQSISNEVITLPGNHIFFFLENIDQVKAKLEEWMA